MCPKPDLFPGTPGTLRVISGIFFLYYFLVRLSGNKGTSARSARKNYSGTSGTLPADSGIFFHVYFLMELSGKQVQWPEVPEGSAIRNRKADFFCPHQRPGAGRSRVAEQPRAGDRMAFDNCRYMNRNRNVHLPEILGESSIVRRAKVFREGSKDKREELSQTLHQQFHPFDKFPGLHHRLPDFLNGRAGIQTVLIVLP